METFRVGKHRVTRIEEFLTPGFVSFFLFPVFDSGTLKGHQLQSSLRFWDESSRKIMSGMHSICKAA